MTDLNDKLSLIKRTQQRKHKSKDIIYKFHQSSDRTIAGKFYDENEKLNFQLRHYKELEELLSADM